MVFEEIFEKIGDSVDRAMKDIGKKVAKSSEEIRIKVEKSGEDILRKMNKYGEKFAPENKDLSNLERAAANFAIALTHSFEKGYEKITKDLFLDENERKTRFGILGRTWSEKYVPRERAKNSLAYAKSVEKLLSTKKVGDEVLKDIVESLSTHSGELYGYYIYSHLFGVKRTKTHDEKKDIIKKFLMSEKERRFYEENETSKEEFKDKVRTPHDRGPKGTAGRTRKSPGNKINNPSQNKPKKGNVNGNESQNTIPNKNGT